MEGANRFGMAGSSDLREPSLQSQPDQTAVQANAASGVALELQTWRKGACRYSGATRTTRPCGESVRM